MNDPWDDVRSQAGFMVTAAGLRVPVAAPVSTAGWPAAHDTPAALRAAATVASYRGVGPKKYQRADAHVRDQICERLLLDPYLDASRIDVKVSKGQVVLSGSVPSERMREAALATAGSVAAGSVESRLEIHGAATSVRTRKNARAKKRPGARAGRKRGGQR